MALSMQTRGTAAGRVARAAPQGLFRAPKRVAPCRADAAAVETSVTSAVIPLTDREHFETVLKETAAMNEVLVVDYFTTWCGPCKLIAPEVEKMAVEYAGKGVRVAKVTCDASNDNKKWAMAIQIKSLPTFRVYRDGKEEHVGQLVGTKLANLRALIDEQLAAN